MKCEKLPGCPFYQQKMPIESGIGAMFRKNYCETDNSKCARYKVSTTVGPQFVPVDLYPNMLPQAEEIIAKAKKWRRPQKSNPPPDFVPAADCLLFK